MFNYKNNKLHFSLLEQFALNLYDCSIFFRLFINLDQFSNMGFGSRLSIFLFLGFLEFESYHLISFYFKVNPIKFLASSIYQFHQKSSIYYNDLIFRILQLSYANMKMIIVSRDTFLLTMFSK